MPWILLSVFWKVAAWYQRPWCVHTAGSPQSLALAGLSSAHSDTLLCQTKEPNLLPYTVSDSSSISCPFETKNVQSPPIEQSMQTEPPHIIVIHNVSVFRLDFEQKLLKLPMVQGFRPNEMICLYHWFHNNIDFRCLAKRICWGMALPPSSLNLLQIKADNPLRSPAVTDTNKSEPLVWPFELCLIWLFFNILHAKKGAGESCL